MLLGALQLRLRLGRQLVERGEAGLRGVELRLMPDSRVAQRITAVTQVLTVVGNLIRRLNDALGATSIIVTHDVQESLKIVDYVYFVSDGAIIADDTPAAVRAATGTDDLEAAFLRLVRGTTDGRPAVAKQPASGRDGAKGATA